MQNNKLLPVLIILVVLLAGVSFFAGTLFTKIRNIDGGQKGPVLVTPTPQAAVQPSPAVLGTIIGNFTITKDEVITENGKPVIYYFGSSTCPHCQWEYPVIKRVMAKFGDVIVFHDDMDKIENDKEIWNKYSSYNPSGAVPFLVFGGKYVRLGSGESQGEKEEEKNLTVIICKLTDGKPASVCNQVKDLVEKIE